MGCLYRGRSVSIRDGVLVNGMGYYFPGWGVSIWVGVSVNGIEC